MAPTPPSRASAAAPAPGRAAPVDPNAVQRALQRLTRADGAPWLHEEVARRMAERLAVIRLQPETVLQWWGWTGGGSTALRSAYPKALHRVAEPTGMLCERSREALRRPWWQSLRRAVPGQAVQHVDEVPAGEAGLIWANMMLHASEDPPATMSRWHRALAIDGFVMFSCLGPDTLKALRGLYRRAGWPPPAQDFVDMHDLGDMLVHAGFADPVVDQETLRLNWADGAAMLGELRSMGGNASPARCPGLRTPRWRAALEAALVGPGGDRPEASFEIIYGHAFKVAPRLPAGGETRVSLEEMRSLVKGRPASSR